MIKIDKAVAIPRRNYKGGNNRKYPWDMEIGDSFFVAGLSRKSVRSAAIGATKRTGRKFSTRAVTEDGVEGFRVWRIA